MRVYFTHTYHTIGRSRVGEYIVGRVISCARRPGTAVRYKVQLQLINFPVPWLLTLKTKTTEATVPDTAVQQNDTTDNDTTTSVYDDYHRITRHPDILVA